MRNSPILIFFAAVLLEGCFFYSAYRNYQYNRLAPASLAEEKLLLHFHKKKVQVTAHFFFKSKQKYKNFVCLFPGKDFPLKFKDRLNNHAQQFLQNFRATAAGKKLRLSYHGYNYGFIIDFSKNTKLTISYTASYTNIRKRKLFSYVLRSGAVWKEDITKLSIIATTEPGIKIKLHPPYDKQSGVYYNLEPIYDLLAEIVPISASKE